MIATDVFDQLDPFALARVKQSQQFGVVHQVQRVPFRAELKGNSMQARLAPPLHACWPAAFRMTDAAVSSPTPYDLLPYDLTAFPQLHPSSLMAVGRLLGLRPVNPRRCRVLELACGYGGSLFAPAESFPESEFIGVDLSRRQIEAGRQIALAAGLSNLRLEVGDIAELDFGEEQFDLILCHGAFSWVPPVVQERLFALCRRHLTQEGIAYISYNCLPGWRLQANIRDSMRFHAGNQPSPDARVSQGLAFLQFLQDNQQPAGSPLQGLLAGQAAHLRGMPVNYLFHEYFGELNQPQYFHEFITQAAQHGLSFLGEATPRSMSEYALQSPLRLKLDALASDPIRAEQYWDFLSNRSFRQTLLCRTDRAMKTSPAPQALFSLYTSIALQADGTDGDSAAFLCSGHTRVTTSHPLAKALFTELTRTGAFPTYLPALLRRIRHQNPLLEPSDPAALEPIHDLIESVLVKAGTFYTALPDLARNPTRKPRASRLSRVMAEQGPRVFSVLNHPITLDNFSRRLIQYLDGETDRPTLVTRLVEDGCSGRLPLLAAGQPVTDEATVRAYVLPGVDKTLTELAARHLLVA